MVVTVIVEVRSNITFDSVGGMSPNQLSMIYFGTFDFRFSVIAPIARNGSDEIYGVLSAGFNCNKPIQSRIGIYTVVNSPFIYPFITSTIQGT